jgi:hypothetical protein
MKDHTSKSVSDATQKGFFPPHSPAVRSGEVGASLLYLNSNNSLESISPDVSKLTPYHAKQAFCLSDNCERFISKVGLDRVGFLTLTFPDNVTDNKEASRRFDSMNKGFLSRFFGEWMLVKERQQRGAWHYHILIDCKTDIRTGINFEEIQRIPRPKYTSAKPALRSIWQLLRDRLPAYGFGRSELLPVRTTAQATSKYLGKYIAKHIGSRSDQDKGVRLTSYSADFPKSTPGGMYGVRMPQSLPNSWGILPLSTCKHTMGLPGPLTCNLLSWRLTTTLGPILLFSRKHSSGVCPKPHKHFLVMR